MQLEGGLADCRVQLDRHDKHSELEGPEHVRQVESQVRHEGLEPVDMYWFELHDVKHSFVEDEK